MAVKVFANVSEAAKQAPETKKLYKQLKDLGISSSSIEDLSRQIEKLDGKVDNQTLQKMMILTSKIWDLFEKETVSSSQNTTARALTEDEENKLKADLNKLLNKYSREMAIDSFASVVGKLLQDQWGKHNLNRFQAKVKEAVEKADELEKSSLQ